MSNITVKFYNSNRSSEMEADSVSSIRISKSEGVPPRAVVYIRNADFDSNLTICEILEGDEILFLGQIQEIESDYPNIFRIEAVVVPASKEKVSNTKSDDLLERFKSENPDILENTEIFEISNTGEQIHTNLLKPSNPPINISDKILKGSLFISTYPSLPLSELKLEVCGSWIARKSGDINLSRRIENHFKKAKINTLTPMKLKNSWPSFGDRVRTNKSSASKYFVSMARLREENSEPMPSFEISENLPKIQLFKTNFNNALSLSWDYEQYTTEKLNIKFVNSLSKNNVTKNVKINLNNIQEYIDSPYSKSFFQSKTGTEILNIISNAFQNYMILSMRNVQAICELIDLEKDINCYDWVDILGTPYKVTSIDTEYTSNGVKTKLKCRGFSEKLPEQNKSTKNVRITNCPIQDIDENDVIQDIIVENEADTQFSKLREYIASISNTINLKSYRSIISKFLNTIPTKISIITKPLKTKSCEILEYNAQAINIF